MIRGRKVKGLISGLNSLNGLNVLEEDSLTAEDVLKIGGKAFFVLDKNVRNEIIM